MSSKQTKHLQCRDCIIDKMQKRKQLEELAQQVPKEGPLLAQNILIYINGHTGIPGLWTQELDAGLWTLNAGLWTLGSERWTLDAGPWTLDAGLWTLDAKPWTLYSRLWTLDATLWTLGSGNWTLSLTVLEQNQNYFCYCLYI